MSTAIDNVLYDHSGYRGSRVLKKPGTAIEWTEELAEEFIKCRDDPIYFGENYFKVVHVDRGLETISLYPYQKDIINSVWHGRRTIAEMARQSGKFLLLDKKLPLYSGGFTTMGEVKVGDTLIDADGKPTKVTFKSDVVVRPTYRITFDDGSICDAGDEHQWEVIRRHYQHKPKVLTTEQMYKNGWFRTNARGYREYKYYIPNTKPVDYKKRDVKIDPYILGIWLGDGTSCNNELTCDINDKQHYINQDVIFGKRRVYHDRPNLYSAKIEQLTNDIIAYYKLRRNKHIPDDFLYGSIEQRIALVQGLFDTDGFVGKNGECCIQLTTKNTTLIDDIQQLFQSLGLRVRRSNHIDKKQGMTLIRLSFTCDKEHFEVARIERKISRQKQSCPRKRYSLSRTIQNIELIDSAPAQCISVDNERRLYLCGTNYLPTHNTSAMTVIILWYVIFHSHKTVAILANRGETAQEILERIQTAYENLPDWLQQGVVEWNKQSIKLENGSTIFSNATSKNAIRGYSVNMLFIDEAAHIEGWDEFWTAVSPVISSGKTTKLILVSTVNGMNHFHKFTTLVRQGKSDFDLISVKWNDVPGRDDAWKQQTLADMNWDYEAFAQEYENEYLGSSGTLISGSALKILIEQTVLPQEQRKGIYLYEEAQAGHTYVLVADVSRGKGLDYSAFQLIDITEMPYRQVVAFRDNLISPAEFAQVIHGMSKHYNEAAVLVEINDIGQQVADMLFYDYECEHLLLSDNAGSRGKKIVTGLKSSTDRGLRTTKTVKNVGCSMLKLLVEQQQLIINDRNTIKELMTFSRKGVSYEAETGCHDDLTMCLVLFAWFSEQQYFKMLTDINTLMKLRERSDEEMMADMIPFGVIDDNHEDIDIGTAIELDKMTDENWFMV